MLEKLSLFELEGSTLQTKLRKSGITNATLQAIKNPEVSFYISKSDPAQYFITLDKEFNKPNYFYDFVNSKTFDDGITIENVIIYIKTELQERYTLGDVEYEFKVMETSFKRQINKLQSDNSILRLKVKEMQDINSTLSKTHDKKLKELEEILQNIKTAQKEVKDLELQKLQLQLNKSEKEKKSLELELKKLQNKLISIKSIAV